MVSDTIRRDLWGLTPPRRSRRAPWPCRPLVRTVTLVIERLLQPLRTAATWRSLVHAVLDLPVRLATFVPIVILLALSGALLITLPLALPVIVVLFMTDRLIGKIERGRVAALHRVQLRSEEHTTELQ